MGEAGVESATNGRLLLEVGRSTKTIFHQNEIGGPLFEGAVTAYSTPHLLHCAYSG